MKRLFAALAFALVVSPAWAEEPPKPLTRIAFGSCADQDKPLPVFDTIAATKPELLLLIGDNIYADLDKSRKVTPEVIQEKYDTLGKLPGYAKLKAACPIMATWDDHDFGKNDAGAEFLLKDESQKLFLDFFGAKPDDPRRTQKGVYTSAVYGAPGKRVQVIMLDTRYHRSAPKKAPFDPKTRIAGYLPNTDPDATVLGVEQWKWLEEELKKPAEVRLLVSSIQVISDDHPFEKWANFPNEREKLYALIKSTGANGVVILSGDRHLAEISLDTKAVGYPLYDVTSSGLNQGSKNWRPPEANRNRVAAMPYGDNFGMILIDWSGDDPKLKLQVRDEDGDTTCGVTVRASTLKGGKAVAAAPDVKLPEGVLSPAQAAGKVGEKVTVMFTVVSTGGQANLYLNSNKDFRAKDNFAVVLTPKAKTGKWDKATGATFTGKTIKATGTIKLFKDAPQLDITDPAQLEIVEK
ncbi:MAG TPA: alkaline phosphatase D family protein [Gemmataceae bacterium]|nr:alkaline phosphatase D family protein [Gemmataceae bacterium]